ncbi:MAG: hypothetical protein QRY74_04225 [Chlamydia sp.]
MNIQPSGSSSYIPQNPILDASPIEIGKETLQEKVVEGPAIQESLTEQELEKSTMLLIQELANKHGFSVQDIHNVSVKGVPIEEDGLAKEVEVQEAYHAPISDKKSSIKTTENLVELWKNEKNGKLYAKIPMQYEIVLKKGNEQKTIQFKQPLYTNIEIREDFTPHEKARAEKRLMAIVVGAREEIRSTALCKDEKAIAALIDKKTLTIEFSYGKSDYLHGKKLSQILKKDPGASSDSLKTPDGVYPSSDSACAKIFGRLFDPIPIDLKSKTYKNEEAIGRTHVGYMRCTYLDQIDTKREAYRKISKEIISQDVEKQEFKRNELHTFLDAHRKELGDLQSIIQLEARSAVEKMSEIDEFFKTYFPFRQDVKSNAFQVDLEAKPGLIGMLNEDTRQIMAKTREIKKILDKIPTEIRSKWGAFSIENLLFIDNKKTDRAHDLLAQKFKALSESEQKGNPLQTELLQIGNLNHIVKEYRSLQEKTVPDHARSKQAAKNWIKTTMEQIEGYNSIVQALTKDSSSYSDKTKEILDYFGDAKTDCDYSSLKKRAEAAIAALDRVQHNSLIESNTKWPENKDSIPYVEGPRVAIQNQKHLEPKVLQSAVNPNDLNL